MVFSKNRNLIRWIIVIASFAIISLILWNTYIFFQNFKAEERTKMENWSFAQNEYLKIINEITTNENVKKILFIFNYIKLNSSISSVIIYWVVRTITFKSNVLHIHPISF